MKRVDSGEWLAALFEENRAYMQSVAYRMLHDGQELYFLSPSNQMMVVSIRAQANGNGVEFDRARPLFEQPLPDGSMFAPTADGRFIVHEVMLTAPPIYVLKDWTRSKVEPNTPLR